MCSPAPTNCNKTAVIAPIPEAATLAVSVPSMTAKASPKCKFEGVEWREYK